MKRNSLLYILPAAFLLLVYITQSWYIEFADKAKVALYGFPLIYIGNGHSDTSYKELYLMEFILDYLFYAAALYLLYRLFRHLFAKLVLPKITPVLLWTLVIVHIAFFAWTVIIPGKFQVYRKIPHILSYMLDKSFSFGWQEHKMPSE